VAGAVETIVDTYIGVRLNGERFNETVARVGLNPFKEKLYAAH
jgi:sulfite reductase (NADPH) hemoprotein beta-component